MDLSFKFGQNPDQPASVEPLPFRIVAVAPFSADDSAPAQLVPVAKENFDNVLAAVAGKLVFDVPNHLATTPNRLILELPFAELNDLAPAGLCEMVEELKGAQMLVEWAKKLSTGDISAAQFEKNVGAIRKLDKLQPAIDHCLRGIGGAAVAPAAAADSPNDSPASAPAAATPVAPPTGGSILDMIDMPDQQSSEAAAQSKLGSFISALGKSAAASSSGAVPAAAKGAEIAQQLLNAQLNEILHHDDFRRLERAWRSLKFLVDRSDFRNQPLRIDVLHASKAQIANRIKDVVLPVYETGSDDPPALIVTDLELDNTAADLDLAKNLAELGEQIQAPVLVGIAGRFVGKPTFAELASLKNPANHFDGEAYTQWQALREKECARWLAVCANRFLLRAAYDGKHRRGAGIVETIVTHESRCWGNAQWPVASLISKSASTSGWPTQFTGTTNGVVGELPMLAIDGDTELPVEAQLPERHADELAAAGIIALVAKPNRDAAYVLRAPSAMKPGHFGNDDTANQTSKGLVALAYQLLAARLGEILIRNKTRLVGDKSPDVAGAALQKFLGNIMAGTGPGATVHVEINPHPDDAHRFIAVATLRTGREILNGVEVHLAVTI